MPQRRSTSRGTLNRLVLFALVGWALVALGRTRGEATANEADAARAVDPLDATPAPRRDDAERRRPRSRRQRVAASFAFATLFFAGAAFSAGAGEMLVQAVESGGEPAAAEEPAALETESCPAGDAAEAGTPGEEAACQPTDTDSTPTGGDEGESDTTEDETGETGETDDPGDEDSGSADDGSDGSDAGEETGTGDVDVEDDDGSSPTKDGENGGSEEPGASEGAPLVETDTAARDKPRALDVEAGLAGATVWLHRTLPDPTPPAKRLAPAFARQLAAEARRAGVDWALVLAKLRAEGRTGRVPAGRPALRRLAKRLDALVESSGEWNAFLAMSGDTSFADRAMALTRLHRAVGLRALVTGLDAAKEALVARTLADSRIAIYAGGRADLAAGRIDVRVVVLIRYLAEGFGTVTVSSLQTGHRIYARPGVVSAHVYGLAVDISALGGSPILGNSQPGGLTERAVREILLLPAGLRPQQLISLLGLGGPSFPLADHADHIHVGY